MFAALVYTYSCVLTAVFVVSIILAEEPIAAKVGRTSNVSKASASINMGQDSDEEAGEKCEDEMEE